MATIRTGADLPKIPAAKAGKHRFTMFHAGGEIWVIHRHYPKGKKKLDRVGKAIIQTTVLAIADYEQGVRDGNIMNAIEARAARRRAGNTTMEERLRQNPEMAQRIDKQLAHLRLEQQMIDAMEREHVNAAELARRVSRQPSAISRDLKGGLSKAKIGRVEEMAEAVDHDFVGLVLSRDPAERRETLSRLIRELAH